jgi:hypothetical protein
MLFAFCMVHLLFPGSCLCLVLSMSCLFLIYAYVLCSLVFIRKKALTLLWRSQAVLRVVPSFRGYAYPLYPFVGTLSVCYFLGSEKKFTLLWRSQAILTDVCSFGVQMAWLDEPFARNAYPFVGNLSISDIQPLVIFWVQKKSIFSVQCVNIDIYMRVS